MNEEECGAIFSFNNPPCDCFEASPVDYFNRRASADEIALVEDAPAVVPDVQHWRKTAENPPTEKHVKETAYNRQMMGSGSVYHRDHEDRHREKGKKKHFGQNGGDK